MSYSRFNVLTLWRNVPYVATLKPGCGLVSNITLIFFSLFNVGHWDLPRHGRLNRKPDFTEKRQVRAASFIRARIELVHE